MDRFRHPHVVIHRQVERLRLITPASRRSLVRTGTQPPPGERGPDQVLVGATVQDLVRLQDGVASVHEARIAGSELQPVDHQLHRDVVATRALVQVRVEAMHGDQLPGHLPQHGAPHESDPVGLGHPTIGIGIGEVVHPEVRAVRSRAYAWARDRFGQCERSDPPGVRALVPRGHGHDKAEEIAPALPHLFGIGQTAGVGGATHEPVRHAMRVLMGDDAIVQVTVDRRGCRVPQEHLHARIAAVRRSGEVGIVGPAAVLCISEHMVTSHATIAIVVLLEIAARFIEPVLVPHVVDDVVPVEEVGDRGILVRGGGLGQVDGEVEVEVDPSVRAVARAIVPVGILLGPDVVASGDGELGPCTSIRVVPPEGARVERVVPGSVLQGPWAMVRAFQRPGIHPVIVRGGRRGGQGGRVSRTSLEHTISEPIEHAMGDPIVPIKLLSRGIIDPDVPPMGTIRQIDVHVPCRAQPIPHGHQATFHERGLGEPVHREAEPAFRTVRFPGAYGPGHPQTIQHAPQRLLRGKGGR